MVKMKNVLFPLLIMVGIGSMPSTWALSGAERAKIKLQLDRALQNDLPLSGKLINQLRHGGEERLADEYATKLEKAMQDNMERLISIAQDLYDIFFTIANAAYTHRAGQPGADANRERQEVFVSGIVKAASARVLQLADLLRRAKDYSLLGVWKPAVQAAVAQQEMVQALNEQVQDANAAEGVPRIAAANTNRVLVPLRHDSEGVVGAVEAAINAMDPAARVAAIERLRQYSAQTVATVHNIIAAVQPPL